MSWKIALTVALLTAVVTAIVTAVVAYKVAGLHGMSDFEGKRVVTVAMLFVPAGLVGGFLLGLLGSKLVGAVDWAQFWKAAGLSIALGQVALWGISGLSLLGIPRPPLLDGQALALEVEVMVPKARITPRSLKPDQIRLSLYAGPKDNAYATIDRSRFLEVDSTLIVHALATLNSQAYGRTISFHIGEGTWLAFDLDELPAKPTAQNFEWTTPKPLRDAQVAGGQSTLSDVLLRYRVVKVN